MEDIKRVFRIEYERLGNKAYVMNYIREYLLTCSEVTPMAKSVWLVLECNARRCNSDYIGTKEINVSQISQKIQDWFCNGI